MSRKSGLGTPQFKKNTQTQRSKQEKLQDQKYINTPGDEHFLSVGRKIEEMISFGNDAIDSMPRNHKPVIGKIMETFMWDLLDLVTTAGRGFHKAKTLETAIVRLDLLRSAVRDGYRRAIIHPKTYQSWAKMNNAIGQELGGWYKDDKNQKKGRQTDKATP